MASAEVRVVRRKSGPPLPSRELFDNIPVLSHEDGVAPMDVAPLFFEPFFHAHGDTSPEPSRDRLSRRKAEPGTLSLSSYPLHSGTS
jgi:hypothetical protein